MSYPYKSTVLRSEAIAMLEADTVFNALSLFQKNIFLNSAIQKLAAFRNEADKEDYQADTLSSTGSSVVVPASLVGTTVERLAYGATLGSAETGLMYFDTDHHSAYWWDGTTWV